MPLCSLKVQTLVARWKHLRSSSSAIFVDDAVLQRALYHFADARRGVINHSGWEILEHEPNSPYLAPSDFHLFPKQEKKRLRAKRFESHDDVKHEVQTWLPGQDPTFFRQGFEKWISCLDRYLNGEGDHVGK